MAYFRVDEPGLRTNTTGDSFAMITFNVSKRKNYNPRGKLGLIKATPNEQRINLGLTPPEIDVLLHHFARTTPR